MRKWTVAAAGLLGLALVTSGAPAIAQAAEIQQVMVNNNDAYSAGTNPGIFTVSIDTDEPVSAIHADFISQQTGQVGGTADNFGPGVREAQWLRYVTTDPVVMDPGSYEVQVTITDADGAVTQHYGGDIRYLVVASVEDVELDRRTIDWDTRDVTVTGVLRGRWPGTGEVRPLGGTEVGWWVLYGGDGPIITADDGTFRRTFTMSGSDNSISLWYGGSDRNTIDSGVVVESVTVTPQPLRLRVRMDKRRAVVGDPVTISGEIERRGAAGWVAAPGERLNVWIQNCAGTDCTDGGNDIAIAADGTFQVVMPAQRTGYFKLTARGYDEFFAAGVAQTKVLQVRPAA